MANTMDIRRIPHLMYEAWNRGDMDTFYSYVDEGVDDVGGESTGLAGVR